MKTKPQGAALRPLKLHRYMVTTHLGRDSRSRCRSARRVVQTSRTEGVCALADLGRECPYEEEEAERQEQSAREVADRSEREAGRERLAEEDHRRVGEQHPCGR